MHDLRRVRNNYAHGLAKNVFPSVPRTQVLLSAFLHPYP